MSQSVPAPDDALRAARPPVGTGLSPLFGQLVALGLIALGVVGIEEALTRSGLISEPSWTRSALRNLDGVDAAFWMVPVSVIAVIVGLLLLGVVLRPRPRKAFELDANTGVYLRTGDLSKLAVAVLEDSEGVIAVRARATRSRLDVTATSLGTPGDNSTLEATVRDRLSPVISSLTRPPRLRISIRNEDFS